jgi:YcaO-like protein with predicted kinase domain
MNLAARLAETASSRSWGLEARGSTSLYLDRVRTPQQTIAAMRPRFLDFGITRLARITGLDVIGIPVWSAIRPNSRTLAASQGKGLDDAAAQASAVMEAIEVAVAESGSFAARLCSASELIAEGRSAAALSGLLRSGAIAPSPEEAIEWIEGYDLLRDAAVWVPVESATLFAGEAPSRYWQSTDGLASGNALWEAVVHGLCERIERDALALWSLRNDAHVAAQCRDPRRWEDAELDRLVGLIEGAGLQLRLFDISSDIAAPTFLAVISPAPNGREAAWRHFDLSSGSGCHPSPMRAAIRAVTEAAQTRLTTISGNRDDFDPETYKAEVNLGLLPYIPASPVRVAPAVATPALARSAYVPYLLERLRGVGARSAVVVPLEAGEHDFCVVKVLVPDLESPPGDRRHPYGRRAVRAMVTAS